MHLTQPNHNHVGTRHEAILGVPVNHKFACLTRVEKEAKMDIKSYCQVKKGGRTHIKICIESN